MTNAQKKQCHVIIHAHAVTAAAGNAIPIPGMGFTTELAASITMTLLLASIFGQSMDKATAAQIALTNLKRQLTQQEAKQFARALSRYIPGLGLVVAPALSLCLFEAAGWCIAKHFDSQAQFSIAA